MKTPVGPISSRIFLEFVIFAWSAGGRRTALVETMPIMSDARWICIVALDSPACRPPFHHVKQKCQSQKNNKILREKQSNHYVRRCTR